MTRDLLSRRVENKIPHASYLLLDYLKVTLGIRVTRIFRVRFLWFWQFGFPKSRPDIPLKLTRPEELGAQKFGFGIEPLEGSTQDAQAELEGREVASGRQETRKATGAGIVEGATVGASDCEGGGRRRVLSRKEASMPREVAGAGRCRGRKPTCRGRQLMATTPCVPTRWDSKYRVL
jgi:hypothetical protein